MLLNQPHSYSADIWSLGVLVLELCLRKPPLHKSGLRCMFTVATRGLQHLIPIDLSDQGIFIYYHSYLGRSFIKQCLEFKPEDRPTASQLLKVLTITSTYNSMNGSTRRD